MLHGPIRGYLWIEKRIKFACRSSLAFTPQARYARYRCPVLCFAAILMHTCQTFPMKFQKVYCTVIINYATSRSRHASRHTRDLKSGAKYYYSKFVIFMSLGPIFWPISSEATGLDTRILLAQHAPKSNKTQIMKVRQVQFLEKGIC
jgi:hypothetical protein